MLMLVAASEMIEHGSGEINDNGEIVADDYI